MQKQVDISWIQPGALCWLELENTDQLFHPATVVSLDSKTNIVTIEMENKSKQTCKAAVLLERADQQIKSEFTNGFEDMVNMETLNDAELLNNLILRFHQDCIFTYVGPTLLVINPFKKIQGLLETSVRDSYVKHVIKQSRSPKDLQPHVFAIAAQAYKFLFDNEKNQAIVISGESGAGKTENAKFAMNLLTSIASQGQADGQPSIEDQILGCNPILESFGNAKTVRNNNSSRFGKYVRIIVNEETKQITGAEIINYLLEKSRINQQGAGERNFHIFYIFLKGLSKQELAKYGIDQPIESYNYLNSSKTYTIPNVDDAEGFKEITECFRVLGLKEFQDDITHIVAAVLLLGNVQFDGSTLNDDNPASLKDYSVGKQLGLDDNLLQQALTLKQRSINKQIINSPLSLEECNFAKDTLAKDLYDRLFNWLVMELNKALKPKGEQKCAVGLLDIYGFEVFDKNGFEQIMINYTNEKLHQLYILYVFKEEEKIFIEEGLQQHCSSIEFQDNTSVIELIDKQPGGIFSLLDESCQVKSTDDAFLQKVRQTHKANQLLKNPRIPSEPAFIIVHTAKDVAYNVLGFRDKNKDEMNAMTISCLIKSTNPLVVQLYQMEAVKDKFITQKIKKEMQELMDELKSCDVHFIRCIKPNEQKVPNLLLADMTLKQIRYLGVLDSLKVRKESYSIRRQYQSFYKRYGSMTKNMAYPALVKLNADFRQLVVDMFKTFLPQLDDKMVLFGKTKIFIRQQAMGVIDDTYQQQLEQRRIMARKIFKTFRIYKIKKALKMLQKVANMFKKSAQRAKLKTMIKKREKMASFIQLWWKFKLRIMWQKKYKEASTNFQIYVKRFYNMQLCAKKKLAILTLQRLCKRIIKSKHLRKQREINYVINKIVDKTWEQIMNKKAVIIQKAYRGFKCRKDNKQIVFKIKHAGRLTKQDISIKKIQSNARVYIARSKFKRAHRAAYKIQGHWRMISLTSMFKKFRVAARIIQKTAKSYISRKVNYRQNFDQFVKPWESNIQQQKVDSQSFWLLSNETGIDLESNQPILEYTIIYWRPKLPKICLFSVPTDIDVLSDLYTCYNPEFSYSRTLLNIIISQIRKDFPIQSFHVTEQSTICTSMGGGSVFEFGDGSLFLNNEKSESVDKIIFPEFVKAKSISTSDQYILLTNCDGTLLQFGDESQSIKYKPYVHNINVQSTSGTYVVSEGKLYNYIGVQFTIPIKQSVKTICTGNNFALALCEGGQLYSWGENNEGELGLGDTVMRTEPNKIVLEKVLQISCGFKHAICRVRGRFYTWGWGDRGQLGHGDHKNELLPRAINQQVYWVACGRTSSHVITNERQVMSCGTNASMSFQNKFEITKLNISLSMMIPVRIISSWSKMLEITYITFANCTSCVDLSINKKLKIINSLIQLWSESPDPTSIDPPFNNAISNYIYEASMKKPFPDLRQQVKSYYKYHKEQMYIDDDRLWAMKKSDLINQINEYQRSIPKDHKLRTIKQRYIDLQNISDLTEEEQKFIDQIDNNTKLKNMLERISL